MPPGQVSAAARYPDGGQGEAIGEAEAAGLVRITSDGVTFSHPLLRSAAYHAAAPAQRRQAHRALAEVLADGDDERAAWHLAAAATGPDEAAAASLDAAAGLTAAKGAPLAAAAARERAADLSETAQRRSARLAAAAEAALDGGDLDRVRRLTEQMRSRRPGPPAGQNARGQGSPRNAGRMTIAQRVLDSAALTAESDPRLAVDLLAEAAFAAIEAGPFGEASLAVARMAALAERSDDTARFRADCSAGYLGWRRGDPDHGARLIRRAVARLEADPLLASRPELQLDSAWAWANIGDHDRARACCGRAVELARSQGAAGRLPDALVLAACMDRDAGRWPSALAHGSQELDLALATGQLTVACEALITAGEIEAAKGRDEGCPAAASRARPAARRGGDLRSARRPPPGRTRARRTPRRRRTHDRRR